jgi:uncharacterized protein with NAD-binding domain and iron-sulfur cluster
MDDKKTRVAVLGGGVSALTTAFALTEVDPKGEKYDITLYQLGWRLGGKTASGRNAEYGQRIEEHGLHVWAGFYENAFTVMRIVFKALNRPASDPVATIGDAFKRQNQIAYAEEQKGTWSPWPFWFEPDADESVFPGRDSLWAPYDVMPSLATLMRRAIASIAYNWQYYKADWPGDPQAETTAAIKSMPPAQQAYLAGVNRANDGSHPLLSFAEAVSADLESDVESTRQRAEMTIIDLLHAFQTLIAKYRVVGGRSDEFRRALIFANFGICMLLGILRHGCLLFGMHVIDHLEFRDFLAEQDEAAANNSIVSEMYEYIFAFENGSRATPRVSACSAVQGLLRLFLTYKGAFFFKAIVGMGDTICTPLYELLSKRGVTFKFFHKVTALEPTDDGTQIGTILIDQQAALVSGGDDYHPLVPVNGTLCWPSTPLWDQLQDGAALAAAGIDFENAYGPPFPPQPAPVAKLSLKLNEDFDKVVLGISMGALADICAPLVAQKPAWRDMVVHLKTVRTQALQLWIDCPVGDLGGPFVAPVVPPVVWPDRVPPPNPMGPIVGTCEPPLDTYADMSQLLPAEAWPAPGPLSVAYFCAVMEDDEAPNDEAIAHAKVRENAQSWMTSWLSVLWTKIGSGADFNWNLLHTLTPAEGPARLDQQFWSANINPSDRYVLSLPDTLKYRMEPGASGYANLYLAGDWTKVVEINAGCVECAAMSGLAAASALSGVAIPIVSANTLYGPVQTSSADANLT